MQAPRFWFKPPHQFDLRATLLAPLGALYAFATARRVGTAAVMRAKCPIICIGNINAGGTGKTPTTIALAHHLIYQGYEVHIVSRGYGGQLKGPIEVNPTQHRARQVGDEPLLLAAFARTWVADDRGAGIKQAIAEGAQVILMDDGFQDPKVHKDMSLIVVDAAKGFGNGRCLPAGPLREPVEAGMRRADAVISIGGTEAQHQFSTLWGSHITQPHLRAELMPLQTGMDWRTGQFIAFAGIGHPEKFFDTLRSLGATLLRTEALDDHQPLTPALVKRLKAEAAQTGAQLVTTEKDAARLPSEFRSDVMALPVRLEFSDQDALEQLLAPILPSR